MIMLLGPTRRERTDIQLLMPVIGNYCLTWITTFPLALPVSI